MSLQIQLKFGKALLAPTQAEENICSYQTHYLGSKCIKMCLRPDPGRKRIFCKFRAHGMCLVAANVVLFLSNVI